MSSTTLTDHVTPCPVSSHVISADWLGDTVALVSADGTLVRTNGESDRQETVLHPDASILVAASDSKRIITGGDDGRVVSFDAGGSVKTLAERSGKWIDAVTTKDGNAFAYSTGRDVYASDGRGSEKHLAVSSSARGIAFAPKGYRLAVSHYNGVTLWFPNIEGKPEFLEWKGSHLDVIWSPDGRFIVTSMQENAMHGWRLQDMNHMRMTGYPSKIRSFSWSADGKWLATSGADAAIVWPFETKDGPIGKAPREYAVRPSRVSKVAFHSRSLVLAIGYEDGCILLVRFSDAAELLVRAPVESSAVTALSWNASGMKLAFGCADGQAGILTLPS